MCGSVKWKKRRDEIRNVAATSQQSKEGKEIGKVELKLWPEEEEALERDF